MYELSKADMNKKSGTLNATNTLTGNVKNNNSPCPKHGHEARRQLSKTIGKDQVLMGPVLLFQTL